MGWRDLGLVDGNNGRQHTNAQTGNNTAKHHHGHRGSKRLQTTADKKDARTVENRSSAANYVTDSSDY